MKRPLLLVISGDIVQVKTDALITATDSKEWWFNEIDRVIKNSSGDVFHDQIKAQMPLKDGQAIVTKSTSPSGVFKNIVFVIDDLQQNLREIIYSGLQAASDAGFKSVSLPAIRMGVMLGEVEKNEEEAAKEMALGIQKFIQENPVGSLESITFVVYNDESRKELLKKAIEQ